MLTGLKINGQSSAVRVAERGYGVIAGICHFIGRKRRVRDNAVDADIREDREIVLVGLTVIHGYVVVPGGGYIESVRNALTCRVEGIGIERVQLGVRDLIWGHARLKLRYRVYRGLVGRVISLALHSDELTSACGLRACIFRDVLGGGKCNVPEQEASALHLKMKVMLALGKLQKQRRGMTGAAVGEVGAFPLYRLIGDSYHLVVVAVVGLFRLRYPCRAQHNVPALIEREVPALVQSHRKLYRKHGIVV